MGLKKLGVVKDIVESVGMGISCAYEDLVFLEHNAILLQFAKDDDTVLLHCNQEAEQLAVQEAADELKSAAVAHEMRFVDGTIYTMVQADPENVRIEFLSAGDSV